MDDLSTGAKQRHQRDPHAGWKSTLAAITSIQAVLALMTRVMPLFAIPLTLTAGVSQLAAGQMAAATSFGSMLFFLWGPALAGRYPALRQLQAGTVLSGVSILLCLTGHWTLMLLAALLIGIGYGPSAPAGSEVLLRVVPQRRRALAFSVKQAGVPFGGLLAGLLLPAIALSYGFSAAIWTSTAIALIGAVGLGFWKGGFEGASNEPPIQRRVLGSLAAAPFGMFELVWSDRRVRVLVLVSLGLGAAQGVLLAYLPVLLNEQAGYSVVAAGAAFAVLQLGGIVGRILVGFLADWIASGMVILTWLCVASGAAMLAFAAIGPNTSAFFVILICMIAGVTVIAWNGVLLAELANASRPGMVNETTAAATFVLFAVFVASPLIASWIFTFAGYGVGLLAAATMPFMAAFLLAIRKSR